MATLPYWDVDYCQFGWGGFKKPTRFFGSNHLYKLSPVLCDGVNCENLGEGRRHIRPLGGHGGSATKALTYPIPEPIVELASGLRFQEGCVRGVGRGDKRVRFSLPPTIHPTAPPLETPKEQFQAEELKPPNEASPEVQLSKDFVETNGAPKVWPSAKPSPPKVPSPLPSPTVCPTPPENSGPAPGKWASWIQDQIRETPCWVRDPVDHPSADKARAEILRRYSPTVLSGKYLPDPPKRGPFGEAEIWVKPNSVPVGIPAYRLGGGNVGQSTRI